MSDGALLGKKFTEGAGQRVTKPGLIGICRQCKEGDRLHSSTVVRRLTRRLTRRAATVHIDGLPVHEADEERPGLANFREQFGTRDHFQKNLLHHIARIGLTPHEIQHKRKQRIGMSVVELCKFGRHEFGGRRGTLAELSSDVGKYTMETRKSVAEWQTTNDFEATLLQGNFVDGE